MTATPIPRSLALTLYGDLAVSVIDELPPGRKPIKTKVLRGNPVEILAHLIKRVKERGEKAYVIYPLVEESEKIDLEDATQGLSQARAILGDDEVVMVHGRMKAKEKDEAMAQFAKGNARILISTTVVEVGVNVPDATAMIIMHGERFGLSQLHQLRGRVGRGDKESFCFLLTHFPDGQNDISRRLSIMEQTNNGFEIANEDLAIRGPGDFLGTKQSGLMNFQFCDLVQHADLIEPARDLALHVLSNKAKHPDLVLYEEKMHAELH
jgi:ATP-dependent DNA helicase RecG